MAPTVSRTDSSECTPRSVSDELPSFRADGHAHIAVDLSATHIAAAVVVHLCDTNHLLCRQHASFYVDVDPTLPPRPHPPSKKQMHRRRMSLSLTTGAAPNAPRVAVAPRDAVLMWLGWAAAAVRPPVVLWTAAAPWELVRPLLDALPGMADPLTAPVLLVDATVVSVPGPGTRPADVELRTSSQHSDDAVSLVTACDALARARAWVAAHTAALSPRRAAFAALAAETGFDMDDNRAVAARIMGVDCAELVALARRRGRFTVDDELRSRLFDGRPDDRTAVLADAVILHAKQPLLSSRPGNVPG